MSKKYYTQLELKETSDSDGTFVGLASVYNVIDNVDDIVAPNAFNESLATGRKVKMLWQHRPDKPIGVFTEIKQVTGALEVHGQINLKTKLGSEAYELLKQGAIDGLSIGYRTIESSYDNDKDVRTIIKADLFEVSVVTFPANEAALVTAVKDFKDWKPKEVEAKLRDDFDLSREEAKTFMAKGYSAVNKRDVLETENESPRDAGESGLIEEMKQAADEASKASLIATLKSLT